MLFFCVKLWAALRVRCPEDLAARGKMLPLVGKRQQRKGTLKCGCRCCGLKSARRRRRSAVVSLPAVVGGARFILYLWQNLRAVVVGLRSAACRQSSAVLAAAVSAPHAQSRQRLRSALLCAVSLPPLPSSSVLNFARYKIKLRSALLCAVSLPPLPSSSVLNLRPQQRH